VQCLSEEAGDKLVADSLTEEITHALVSMGAVRVVARTSAYRFAAGPRDVRAIARDLKADAVLEGSLRRVDGGYRVTAQLIQGVDGLHSWSRAWNYGKVDVFRVAPEIAAGVAETVGARVPARATKPLTENSEALMLYARASAVNRKVFRGAVEEAVGLLRRALGLDPKFANAYALLAHCYSKLGLTQQLPAAEAYPLAEEAVANSLRMDPENAFAHTVRGDVEQHFRWRWPESRQSIERALHLDPHFHIAHHYLSHYYLSLGKMEEALQSARRMVELDPLDPEGFAHLAFTHIYARDYREAFQAVEYGLKLERDHVPTLAYLRRAAEESGDFAKAIGARRLIGNPPKLLHELESGLARDGAKGYWRALLEYSLSSPTQRDLEFMSISATYARLGEKDEALAWLGKALEARVAWLTYLRIERAYDGIRDDPRFQRIVERVGIPG
jgi:TolB-like protein/tetratricopeptide (TPR) repeat protein